jgi:hypothetical protein
VTARLLSMLDPTGIMAVVNSFIAFFNAIQSAIEYFRQILEIVNSFVSTVAEIARGSIEGAAQFLENTLAQSLPVAIGFLANQVGLGNLGERIAEIIGSIRELIDRALNWLMDQAMNLGRSVLQSLGLGGTAAGAEGANPTDHTAMATQAANEMEQVEGQTSSYNSLRTQKEQQARQVEQRYTDRLEPGIALRIKFTNTTADQADQDIDFEVEIAPNTTTKPGSVPVQAGNTSSPVAVGDTVFVMAGGWTIGTVESNSVPGNQVAPGTPGAANLTFIKVKHSVGTGYINNSVANTEFSSGNYQTIRPRSQVPQNLQAMLNHPLLHPGPHANANGYLTTNSFDVSSADRINIQPLGNLYGCHHGGAKGNDAWIPDHQPPSALIQRGILTPRPVQHLYPHSKQMSDSQGGTITALLRAWGFI